MISHYLANRLLDRYFRNQTTIDPPVSVWAALSWSMPSPEETTTADEIDGPAVTAYERVQITFNAARGRRIENLTPISFPTPTDIWATDTNPIKSVFITDAATAGNILVAGNVLRPKKILAYDSPVVLYKGFLKVYLNTKGMLFSTYFVNKLLDWAFRGVAYVPPATIYMGLFQRALSAAVPVSFEVAGGTGYARQPVSFSAADNGEILNEFPVPFPTPSATWGTLASPVRGYALCDADVGGNWLAYCPLSPRVVTASRPAVFKSKELRIALGAGI